MKTLNLQQELKFVHSEKTKDLDKKSLSFDLLNIAGVLLANYATAEIIAMKNFYHNVYSKTKKFYLGQLH